MSQAFVCSLGIQFGVKTFWMQHSVEQVDLQMKDEWAAWPESALLKPKQMARDAKSQQGWLFTLDSLLYIHVMNTADNAELYAKKCIARL